MPVAIGRTRAEPNKSAIDLAVKALREKERQKGYSTELIRRPSHLLVHPPAQVLFPTLLPEKKSQYTMYVFLSLSVHFKASTALVRRARDQKVPTPDWHAPWKLSRVMAGHLGWVRCIAMDISNEWFATGSADRTIKIWDLASGNLKLTLTGHSHTVRGLSISARSPYLFSCGEDKTVKCWDLERNEVCFG